MIALHYIAEDEDEDIGEYLLPEDYDEYVKRQAQPQQDVMIFPPKYLFRPTAQEVSFFSY